VRVNEIEQLKQYTETHQASSHVRQYVFCHYSSVAVSKKWPWNRKKLNAVFGLTNQTLRLQFNASSEQGGPAFRGDNQTLA
jgi:hypothetical protein